MSDLLIRVGYQSGPLLKRALRQDTDRQLRDVRLVADAHAIARDPDLAQVARVAGVPLIVDPQTFFLQDEQHADDSWARLPFARPERITPEDLSTNSAVDDLIREVVGFQAAHGATILVPPYLHLRPGWEHVQARIWNRVEPTLRAMDLALPRLLLLSTDWTALRDQRLLSSGDLLSSALRTADVAELALAVSKAHTGKTAPQRLHALVQHIERIALLAPVLAWQQGLLGEAAVAAGATGYETGIGVRESYDITRLWRQRRHTSASRRGGRSAPPVYVPVFGHSIPKNILVALRQDRRLWPQVLCHDPTCCAPGGATMLNDARAHAVLSRRRRLDDLDSTTNSQWRWNVLGTRAEAALRLTTRINRSVTLRDLPTLDPTVHTAIHQVSHDMHLAAKAQAS